MPSIFIMSGSTHVFFIPPTPHSVALWFILIRFAISSNFQKRFTHFHSIHFLLSGRETAEETRRVFLNCALWGYIYFFYFFHSMPLFASTRISFSQLNILSRAIIWYLTWFIRRHNMASPGLKFWLHEMMELLIIYWLSICSPALYNKLGLRTIWRVSI